MTARRNRLGDALSGRSMRSRRPQNHNAPIRQESTDMKNSLKIAVTGQSLIKHDIRQIDKPGFQAVCSLLHKADLAFTNFESTILGSHGGWPLKGAFFGCSQPVVLDTLQALGFQALSLSNNHAFDLGPAGVLSTLEEVDRRGFLHAGIGRNQTAAVRPARGTFAGRKVALVAMDGGPGPDFMYAADGAFGRPERPGINRLKITKVIDVDADTFEQLRVLRDKIGYTAADLGNDSQPDDAPPVDADGELCIARAIFRRAGRVGKNVKVDEDSLSRNLAAITSAAEDGCLVIAYLHHHHWESVWADVPAWVGDVARQCIDAGAAMFVSHGAPVLQPIEIYRGKPIFYSLGNFIFHVRSEKSPWRAREVWESVVPVCTFGEDGALAEIRAHPIVIGGAETLEDNDLEKRLTPERAYGEDAERILRRFCNVSTMSGATMSVTNDTGHLVVSGGTGS